LRRAWFLPFGLDDERLDFYAPMKADPSDELALSFYNNGGAQLTHYVLAPAYAKTFSSCLTKQEGFTRVVWRPSGKGFHAELKEASSKRRVVVRTKGDTTAILVASETWKGDIGQALSLDHGK
jgi:hypothetical protein